MNNIIDVELKKLRFSGADGWKDVYAKEKGDSILVHPIYLALRGDRGPLEQWCNFRKDIWLMERLDLVMDVYKSLIRYGQIEPIVIRKDLTIVTGEKRVCCMLIMGKDTIKAVYENS